MPYTQIKKYSYTQILITLSLILLATSCSQQDAANSNINSAPPTLPAAPSEATSTNISLSWIAPSERENNVPISLSEIAGYKLYYGLTQNTYLGSININDGSVDNYTFNSISAGTYYFTVTTYDYAGRESQYSSEVKIVV